MYVSCPNCETTYYLPPGSLGPSGRPVRCSRCNSEWYQRPVGFSQPAPLPLTMVPSYPVGQTPVHGMAHGATGAYGAGTMPPQSAPMFPPSYESGHQPVAPAPVMPPVHQEEHQAMQPVAPAVAPPPPSAPFDDIFDDEAGNKGGTENTDKEPLPPAQGEATAPATESKNPNPFANQEDDEDDVYANMDDALDNLDDVPLSLSGDANVPNFSRASGGARKKGGLSKFLLVLIFLGGCLYAGAYYARDWLHANVPMAADLLEPIGLGPVLGDGLMFRDINWDRDSERGMDFLMISGNVINTTGKSIAIPLIQVDLLGESGTPIFSATREPPQPEVNAGGVVSFDVRIDNPPLEARQLNVTFAPRKTP